VTLDRRPRLAGALASAVSLDRQVAKQRAPAALQRVEAAWEQAAPWLPAGWRPLPEPCQQEGVGERARSVAAMQGAAALAARARGVVTVAQRIAAGRLAPAVR
jgi:hypothetical protein